MRRLVLGLGTVVVGCTPRVFAEPPAPPAQKMATSAAAPASPPAPTVTAVPTPPSSSCGAPIAKGDRVICNWQGRDVYYPGRVDQTDDKGGVTIQYDDGDREQTVATRCLHEPARSRVAQPTPAPTADPDGIAGTYRIAAATNPGGGAYTGSVAITRSGDVYQLGWTIAGSPGYQGVGLHAGSVLGVGWSTGSAPGVVVYKVHGGKLDGKWATGTSSHVGVEMLEGPPGLSGTYRITRGRNPDGSSYTGRVKITPKGKLYRLAWSIPGTSYTGVGILKDHVLSVGWGRGSAPGVVAYGVNHGTLDGAWVSGTATRLGKERLERQ